MVQDHHTLLQVIDTTLVNLNQLGLTIKLWALKSHVRFNKPYVRVVAHELVTKILMC